MSADWGYQQWFKKYPPLLEEQKSILESAGFKQNDQELSEFGAIAFTGNSKCDPERKLVVRFPNAFPSRAPQVFDSPPSKLLRRHHRGDSRQLCLFGFNENRWNATKSVADALSEAEELISTFGDGNSEDNDEPPEPLTRTIIYGPGAAFLVPPPISTFNEFAQMRSASGRCSGKFIYEGDFKSETVGRGIILQAEFGSKKLNASLPLSNCLGNTGKDFHGYWFYLETAPTQETLVGVLKKCFEQSKTVRKDDYHWLALIFNEEVGRHGQLRLTWLLARAQTKSGKVHLIRTFPYVEQERYVRIPGLEGLEERRVAIVGCGSLGSKIAANLAATGVNKFRLIDCDYFEPNNSVRHELGVENFGLNKERALLQRLVSLNPAVAANSKSMAFPVGGLVSFPAEVEFYNLLKDSDLVVDAVAIHSVSHYLNELAFELRFPALFTSVTNGAWGGEVVRSVPGKTACWLCWLDQYFDSKPPSAPTPVSEVFAPGCDQPTFTGSTYDVGIVANLASAMAVETLLAEDKENTFQKNYLRWSGRDKDGSIYSTEMLSTKSKPECWLCGIKHGI